MNSSTTWIIWRVCAQRTLPKNSPILEKSSNEDGLPISMEAGKETGDGIGGPINGKSKIGTIRRSSFGNSLANLVRTFSFNSPCLEGIHVESRWHGEKSVILNGLWKCRGSTLNSLIVFGIWILSTIYSYPLLQSVNRVFSSSGWCYHRNGNDRGQAHEATQQWCSRPIRFDGFWNASVLHVHWKCCNSCHDSANGWYWHKLISVLESMQAVQAKEAITILCQ